MNRNTLYRLGLGLWIVLVPCVVYGLSGSADLIASLAELPGLAESPEKGAFVELVKAIDEVYTAGTIEIRVYPFARSVDNVMSGIADFHIPSIRNRHIDQTHLPYHTVTVKMGTVCFVIYSHRDAPVTQQMLDEAIRNAQDGIPFPYTIEIPRGIENQFPFPAMSTNNVVKSLKLVALKRLDAWFGRRKKPISRSKR